jgi:hypothetical protein
VRPATSAVNSFDCTKSNSGSWSTEHPRGRRPRPRCVCRCVEERTADGWGPSTPGQVRVARAPINPTSRKSTDADDCADTCVEVRSFADCSCARRISFVPVPIVERRHAAMGMPEHSYADPLAALFDRCQLVTQGVWNGLEVRQFQHRQRRAGLLGNCPRVDAADLQQLTDTVLRPAQGQCMGFDPVVSAFKSMTYVVQETSRENGEKTSDAVLG